MFTLTLTSGVERRAVYASSSGTLLVEMDINFSTLIRCVENEKANSQRGQKGQNLRTRYHDQ